MLTTQRVMSRSMGPQDLIRAVAFDYVDQLSDHGEVPIAWADLSNFSFEGRRAPLVSQQGIFKPAALDLPIAIRTTYREPGQLRPFEDKVDENGYLLCRYRVPIQLITRISGCDRFETGPCRCCISKGWPRVDTCRQRRPSSRIIRSH